MNCNLSLHRERIFYTKMKMSDLDSAKSLKENITKTFIKKYESFL